MADYSIGEALRKLVNESSWGDKMYAYKIMNEWEQIVGATFARYTQSVKLVNKILIIQSDVAPFKHELQIHSEQLKQKINQYLGAQVVFEIKIR